MFCKNCGREIPPGVRFCTNCGADNGITPGYGAAPPYNAYPARAVEKKSVATAIILSIFTCGIYSIFWFISLTNDVNTVSEDPMATSGGIAFLLSLVTCGIYSYIWAYKQGEKLDKLAAMRGQAPSSRSLVYLLLTVFGLGIVAYALMQDSINKLA